MRPPIIHQHKRKGMNVIVWKLVMHGCAGHKNHVMRVEGTMSDVRGKLGKKEVL